MSYAHSARQVRDASRPVAAREAALVRCVWAFAPFGLLGTIAHLDRLTAALHPTEAGWPADRLVAAVDLIDAARVAWIAELARFAEQRRTAKARGQRRAAPAELTRYATFGWPGDQSGPAASRALDPDFLRRYGMVPWPVEPVDIRRRSRRAERERRSASRFDGCLLTAIIAVEAVLGGLAWLIFDPPRIFWYGFGGTAVAAVLLCLRHGFRTARNSVGRRRVGR